MRGFKKDDIIETTFFFSNKEVCLIFVLNLRIFRKLADDNIRDM